MNGDGRLDHLSRLGLSPAPEPADGLESFETDGLYLSHARPVNGSLTAIHFIFRDRTITSCQYADLDSGSQFSYGEDGGHTLRFRFKAALICETILEGRNLWQLYDCITRHRMPWVHELAVSRDFEAANASIVNRITFRPVGG